MKEKQLCQKYGNPILEKCASGWCVPDPRWCIEYLDFSWFGHKCLLAHDNLVDVLRLVETECWAHKISLDWIKEASCWVPRCKNINPKRGLSLHAWGLAVDFNWTENPYGTANKTIPQDFIECMEKYGFTWGGRWRVLDPHHFELEEL